MTTRHRSDDERNEMYRKAFDNTLSDEGWAELYEKAIGECWEIFGTPPETPESILFRGMLKDYAEVIEQGRRKQNANQAAWGALAFAKILCGSGMMAREAWLHREAAQSGSKGGKSRAENIAARNEELCDTARGLLTHPKYSEFSSAKIPEIVATAQKKYREDHPGLSELSYPSKRTVRDALKLVVAKWRARA
jgi:hypothetical protein